MHRNRNGEFIVNSFILWPTFAGDDRVFLNVFLNDPLPTPHVRDTLASGPRLVIFAAFY